MGCEFRIETSAIEVRAKRRTDFRCKCFRKGTALLQVGASTLDVQTDQVLFHHLVRRQVFEILRDKAGRRSKFVEGAIQVF